MDLRIKNIINVKLTASNFSTYKTTPSPTYTLFLMALYGVTDSNTQESLKNKARRSCNKLDKLLSIAYLTYRKTSNASLKLERTA